MPKIKLNKFEGIYTNIDENDSRFDLFRESINFRHEYGFIQFEPRHLSSEELPPVDSDAGDAPGTWSWETGIYSIVTSDRLSYQATPQQWNILMLIAKKLDSGVYYRRIYYKVIDTTPWQDAIATSYYPDYSIFSTTKEGDVKIVADQGAIKIYMPHDCFWFGYLRRKRKTRWTYSLNKDENGAWQFTDDFGSFSQGYFTGFYLDRLVEPNSDALFEGDDIVALAALPTNSIGIDNDSMRLKVFVYPEMITGDTLDDATQYNYSLVQRSYVGNEGHFFHKFHFNILDESGNWDEKSRLGGGDGTEFKEVWTGSGTIAPNGGPYPTGENKLYNGVNAAHQLPPTYRIPGTDTYTTQAYYDQENVVYNDLVYYHERAEKNLFAGPTDWVVTATLDETTEIVIAKGSSGTDPETATSPTDAEKYLLWFKYQIPYNINQRITRLSTYIREYTWDDEKTKWTPNTDYERAHTETLIITDSTSNEEQVHLEAKLSGSDFDGTTLSSQIGIIYEAGDYNIITGFRDYARERGIGIGIDYEDYINIYYSVVGGGVLQSDLIYKANKLELPGISFVNALAPVNGNIAALTDVSTHIVKPDEIAGVLAFSILQSMNYGVKNFHDIAVIPGGFIMHTRTGIYFTNGYGQPDLISEPINDVVKANYSTGSIIYNPRLNELYYRPSSNDDLYRFRFDRKIWELRNATITEPISDEESSEVSY